MPLIVKFCRIDDDDELREYCIQVSNIHYSVNTTVTCTLIGPVV